MSYDQFGVGEALGGEGTREQTSKGENSMMKIAQRISTLRLCATVFKSGKSYDLLQETALVLEGLSEQYNSLAKVAVETIADNGSIADGDNCTLFKLRTELEKQGQIKVCIPDLRGERENGEGR